VINLILSIGRCFDWLTPMIAFFNEFSHGPGIHFYIPVGVGLSRSEINRLLTQHGVQVIRLMYSFDGENLILTVPKKQANYVYHLLNYGEDYFLDEFEEYLHSPT